MEFARLWCLPYWPWLRCRFWRKILLLQLPNRKIGLGGIGQNAKRLAMVECLQVAPASACAVFRGQLEYPQSQESL
jgi:hypothetical protein